VVWYPLAAQSANQNHKRPRRTVGVGSDSRSKRTLQRAPQVRCCGKGSFSSDSRQLLMIRHNFRICATISYLLRRCCLPVRTSVRGLQEPHLRPLSPPCTATEPRVCSGLLVLCRATDRLAVRMERVGRGKAKHTELQSACFAPGQRSRNKCNIRAEMCCEYSAQERTLLASSSLLAYAALSCSSSTRMAVVSSSSWPRVACEAHCTQSRSDQWGSVGQHESAHWCKTSSGWAYRHTTKARNEGRTKGVSIVS
jgi:hypothetical protein